MTILTPVLDAASWTSFLSIIECRPASLPRRVDTSPNGGHYDICRYIYRHPIDSSATLSPIGVRTDIVCPLTTNYYLGFYRISCWDFLDWCNLSLILKYRFWLSSDGFVNKSLELRLSGNYGEILHLKSTSYFWTNVMSNSQAFTSILEKCKKWIRQNKIKFSLNKVYLRSMVNQILTVDAMSNSHVPPPVS